MSKITVTILGRTYDLSSPADLTSVQDMLVSDNWTETKADGVRLFLSLQNMLAAQLKRHLAANFKSIMKTAIEEGTGHEDNPSAVAITFAFTIDMSVPTIATISAHKLGFSVRHETKGQPQTHDMLQGEFLDEEMAVSINLADIVKGETS